jgi:DNA-binding winged helix-turn-helix (wHTH) protein
VEKGGVWWKNGGRVIYTFGPSEDRELFVLDAEIQALRKGSKLVDLDPTEIKLLQLFADQPKKVFSKDELKELIRGDTSIQTAEFAKKYISTLRKALDDGAAIKTERSSGYRFGWKVFRYENPPLTVTLTVSGKAITAKNQETAFRVTSGQQNFDCEESRPFKVDFPTPPDTTIVGQATAAFLNFANANIVGAPTVTQNAGVALASGVLRGLDYQNFGFGIRNCPGGGHGELVLSGVYRSTARHAEEVTRVLLANDLTTASSKPLLVMLPDLEVSSIKAVCKPKFGQGRTFTVTVTSTGTRASDGPFQVNYVPQKKQIGLSFK